MSSENTCSTDGDDHRNGCLGANRYIILILALLFLSFNLSSMITYNATYVSLVNLETSPYWLNFSKSNKSIDDVDWNSANLDLSDRRFAFTTIHKSLGFAAGFLGAIIAVVPLAQITKLYGCHKVMTLIGALSTVLLFLTPTVISSSFALFVALRILQGFALSNLFTVAGIIVNEWAMVDERGLFISTLSAHVEVGAVFTMPVSGAIATHAGWPSAFYLHAIILGLLTILWAFYYRDRAAQHPFVSNTEFRKIKNGKLEQSQIPNTTPIKKILSSLVIWSVWTAVIGNFLVSQFSISYAPIYLHGVIGCDPSQAGLFTLIPMACLLVIKFLTGFLSDRIESISELSKMRIFNSCALLGSSVFFLILSCSEPGHNRLLDIVFVSIPLILLGFSSGGYAKCALIVAGQHSPFVMSIVQVCTTTSHENPTKWFCFFFRSPHAFR